MCIFRYCFVRTRLEGTDNIVKEENDNDEHSKNTVNIANFLF